MALSCPARGGSQCQMIKVGLGVLDLAFSFLARTQPLDDTLDGELYLLP